jgi:peroxiredoxin Q/BCP
MRPTVRPLLAAALLLATATLAGAQGPAAPAAPAPAGPAVGEMAPDFTAAWADASGPRATPVTLSALRGQVVVLAFYPKDRSSGCTAELTRFRDEHATLFGDGVVVLPISVDADTTHAAWAKEMGFPFALVADPDLAVAERYGSRIPGRAMAARTVYVIGRDGRVTYREPKFNALAENAYVTLAAEVRKARETR